MLKLGAERDEQRSGMMGRREGEGREEGRRELTAQTFARELESEKDRIEDVGRREESRVRVERVRDMVEKKGEGVGRRRAGKVSFVETSKF